MKQKIKWPCFKSLFPDKNKSGEGENGRYTLQTSTCPTSENKLHKHAICKWHNATISLLMRVFNFPACFHLGLPFFYFPSWCCERLKCLVFIVKGYNRVLKAEILSEQIWIKICLSFLSYEPYICSTPSVAESASKLNLNMVI